MRNTQITYNGAAICIQEVPIDTPLGQALVGKAIKQTVSFTVPRAGEVRIQVIDIY